MSYGNLTVKQQHALQDEWFRVAKKKKGIYSVYYADYDDLDSGVLDYIFEMRPHEQFQTLGEHYVHKLNYEPFNVRWFKGNECVLERKNK